jgi:hypothetical protein
VTEDRDKGPQVAWLDEPVPITVDQALQPRVKNAEDEDNAEARECEMWLGEFLMTGPRPSVEVIKAGSDARYSRNQLKRAKQHIKAFGQKQGFQDGSRWMCGLPTRASM